MARPNDPCRCGSGLKYKKCCLKKKRAAKAAAKTLPKRLPKQLPPGWRDVDIIVDFYEFPEACRQAVEKAFSNVVEFTKEPKFGYRHQFSGEPRGTIGLGTCGLMTSSHSLTSANRLKERILGVGGEMITHRERESQNLTEILAEEGYTRGSGSTVKDVLSHQGTAEEKDQRNAQMRKLDRLYGGDALLEETALTDAVSSFLDWRAQQERPAVFERDQVVLAGLLAHLDEHGWDLLEMERVDVPFAEVATFHGLFVGVPSFVTSAATRPELVTASLEEIRETLKALIRFWTDQALLSETGHNEMSQMLEKAFSTVPDRRPDDPTS